MYDRVTISESTLTVETGKGKRTVEEYALWLLIPLCTVFAVTVFRHVDSPIKYLIILFLIGMIPYYKFVYLKYSKPVHRSSAPKFSVTGSKIEYFNGMHTYVIPVTGIASIEDRSRYHDFRGSNERGWNHLFVIKLQEDCNVLRISSSSENYLKGKNLREIPVFDLVLKHPDYEKVLNFLLCRLQ